MYKSQKERSGEQGGQKIALFLQWTPHALMTRLSRPYVLLRGHVENIHRFVYYTCVDPQMD